jgi:S1/P1 Nuclease
MKRTIVGLCLISLLSVNGFAYGDRGHRLVGAIADKRLAQNQAAAQKVRQLLHGLTLEQAAILPDTIRGFRCGAAPSGDQVNRQLQAFVNANCLQRPRHTDYHFTDVPVFKAEEYGAGHVGREDFDIVHMIPTCIQVLKGEVPETNDRKITKTIAIILLAHYLGDIHQPMHVGAEFFNLQGQAFQPASANGAFNDLGGNRLTLHTFVQGRLRAATNLHTYWDTQTVTNAFGNQSNLTVANRLSSREPENWELTGDVGTWAEQMANAILPTAREAHTRLRFDNIRLDQQRSLVASGNAFEKTHAPGDKFYAIWAQDVVRTQIHKGGWRLAALLEAVL